MTDIHDQEHLERKSYFQIRKQKLLPTRQELRRHLQIGKEFLRKYLLNMSGHSHSQFLETKILAHLGKLYPARRVTKAGLFKLLIFTHRSFRQVLLSSLQF